MISLKEPSNEPVAVNGENRDKGKDYKVSIPEAPRTGKRRPYVPSKQSKLVDAGTARATIGASNEAPQGTTKDNWAGRHQDQTVAFGSTSLLCSSSMIDNLPPTRFSNNTANTLTETVTGVIWPTDTWRGFRDWAFFWPLAAFGTFIIHLALSYPTSPTLVPDPCFRIYLNNVYRNKHGSDTMSFDSEGRFRPQHFEDWFAKYDKNGKGRLTKWEIITGLRGQAFTFDFFGCSAAVLEWLATYLLLWPDDGVLQKDDVRRVFDGSIFFEKAEQYTGVTSNSHLKTG